ncbi:MAG: hypothetical protein O3A78_06635 [Nitrospinae bacterium]|jgi:hypothetical protein|nr:hypothetical protein [Nitrospinota bacterium]MDA1109478.1 hypothetical protein [Nitrospinota bacterium]
MSTILNTLKKLEEEKSVLEKNINLKGLLLQGQESTYPQFGRQAPRRWGLLGGLAAGGVLFAGLAIYYFSFSEPRLNRMGNINLSHQASLVPKIKKPPEKVATSPGIPLSGIPETEPVAEDDLLMDKDFFGPEDALPLMVETTAPAIVEQPEPNGSAEIREIENLIQAATIPVEVASQSLEERVSSLNGVQHIPGLKLKGIIFFSPNNAANHVYVATNADKNKKLKVGDTLLDSTLESIEAHKAIFSYKGQRVEAHIGG